MVRELVLKGELPNPVVQSTDVFEMLRIYRFNVMAMRRWRGGSGSALMMGVVFLYEMFVGLSGCFGFCRIR